MPKHLHNLLLPPHVYFLCQVLPIVASRLTNEAAVFSTQAKFGNVAHPLVKELLIPTADDPYRILGICCQSFQRAQYAVGRNGSMWIFNNRRQCAIVIKHEKTFLSLIILLNHLDPVKSRRKVALAEGGKVCQKSFQEIVRPSRDCMRRYIAVQSLMVGFLALFVHL